VQSVRGESLGWIEDLLFDWQTGEIAAYILTGAIAESLGGRAVLAPADVESIALDYVVIRAGTADRLLSEAGLPGFLSEKSHQVRDLVKLMGDRLHHLIAPHDPPDVVQVKIKTVGDDLAATQEHDHHALKEAIAMLQDQWQHLQQNINRTSSRAKSALDSAWQHLTGQR
jgi:PRC-barrel domain